MTEASTSPGGVGGASDASDAHALEVLEESLQRGRATCVAFNRRGTLLAAGTAAGVVEIWDFETRAVARELYDARAAGRRRDASPGGSGFEPLADRGEHLGGGAAVLSVHWSADGARLIASCADGSVSVWDARESDTVFRATFDAPLHDARFSPTNASLALAAPSDAGPMTFALTRGRRRAPLPTMPGDIDVPSLVCRIPSAGLAAQTAPGHAVFSLSGAHAFVAGARGVVTVVETATADIVQACKVPDAALIKRLELSVCGKHLLVLGNGRTVASYDVDESANAKDETPANVLKSAPPANAFALGADEDDGDDEDEEVRDHVSRDVKETNRQKKGVLTPSRVFANANSRGQWSAAAFSHDARFAVAASSGGAHELHVWRRESGEVRAVAVGAEASKGVAQIVPHPTRAVFVVLGSNGVMYVWSRAFAEKWSAFEPGFVELDDNEAYVEREDEFDVADGKRDPGDPSGSVAKALANRELVARGAAVEAAARVTEAELAVRRELEAMEGAEAAEAERSALAAAPSGEAPSEGQAASEPSEGLLAPAPVVRPPLDDATETAVVSLVGAAAPAELAAGGDASGGAPLAAVRAVDQSAALELAAALRGARSEAAAAAAAAAEAASLAKSSELALAAEQARARAEARDAAERAATLGMTASELDPELADVDVWTNPGFGADEDGAEEMHHLPLELAPDPEATLVIETRTRRWRERERRQLEARETQGTQETTQETTLETQGTRETRRADEDTGEGSREAAKKNAERDGEGEVVEAAGEKRKRADALLSLNDSEADPGARGMDLDR